MALRAKLSTVKARSISSERGGLATSLAKYSTRSHRTNTPLPPEVPLIASSRFIAYAI